MGNDNSSKPITYQDKDPGLFPGLFSSNKTYHDYDEMDNWRNGELLKTLNHVYPSKHFWDNQHDNHHDINVYDAINHMIDDTQTVSMSEPLALEFIICKTHIGKMFGGNRKTKFMINSRAPNHECKMNCNCLNDYFRNKRMKGGAEDDTPVTSDSPNSESSSSTFAVNGSSSSSSSDDHTNTKEYGMVIDNSSIDTDDLERMQKNLFSEGYDKKAHARVTVDYESYEDDEDLYDRIDQIEKQGEAGFFSSEDQEILGMDTNTDTEQYMRRHIRKNGKYN
jgi:hypothetical protein